MNARRYKDFLMRAFHDTDKSTLDSIAEHLVDCEQAKQMMIAKGYGTAAMKAGAIVRMVPDKE